jgi:hypothetical protein
LLDALTAERLSYKASELVAKRLVSCDASRVYRQSFRETYTHWGIPSGDPRWSSFLLDSFLDDALVSASGEAVVHSLLELLVEHQVALTKPVAHLVQDIGRGVFIRDRTLFSSQPWPWLCNLGKQLELPSAAYFVLKIAVPKTLSAYRRGVVLGALASTEFHLEAIASWGSAEI